jgi:hypothetical protein
VNRIRCKGSIWPKCSTNKRGNSPHAQNAGEATKNGEKRDQKEKRRVCVCDFLLFIIIATYQIAVRAASRMVAKGC